MPKGWTKFLKRDDIVAKSSFFEISEDDCMDLKKVFGNNNPICLDVGCGKGEFLAEVSKIYPKTNFLGIEAKKKRIVSTLIKLDVAQNSNVRLFHHFVKEDLSSIFGKSCFERIYINFPDPWPKAKQKKRRLITEDFVKSVVDILKPKGVLKISTDNVDYAQNIRLLLGNNVLLQSLKLDGEFDSLGFGIKTFFEKCQKQKGFEAFHNIFRKIA